MRKLFLIFFLFLSLLFASMVQARAQAQDHLYRSVYRMTFIDQWRAMLRSGFMAGSGYATGYMDYLIPVLQNDRSLVFFTPKASFTDDDSNEQNIGVGYRYLNYAESLILGGNVFFDTRRSVYRNRFNQVGAGLEFLTKWIDARVNGYFLTTDEKRIAVQDTYALGQDGLLRYEGFEEPLSGLDYELGFLIPGVSNVMETRLYVGGYRYDSRKFEDVIGERLRLEIMPTRFMTLEMKADFGHDGHTYCSYGGYVTLPFDIGNIFRLKNPFEGWGEMVGFGRGPREMTERMTDRVVRDLDIVRKVGAAKNAVIEQQMIYVDNTNTTGTENGTREHPYNTLAEAFTDADYGDGSWIYVDKGDGTAAGYTGNYTLADSVVLWGSGYNGGFPGVVASTHPVIDGGGAGSTVTLGRYNTVMGVQLQNAQVYPNGNIKIVAPSSGGTVHIDHNRFILENSNEDGISADYINDGVTSLDIHHNAFIGQASTALWNDWFTLYIAGEGATKTYIYDNHFQAIRSAKGWSYIYNSGGAANENYIHHNTFDLGDGEGWAFEIDTDGGAGVTHTFNHVYENTFNLDGISGLQVGPCIFDYGTGGSSTSHINNNIVNMNGVQGYGIYLSSYYNGVTRAYVYNNKINMNQSDWSTGILFWAGYGDGDHSSLTADVYGNTIAGGGLTHGCGLWVYAENGTTVYDIHHNTIGGFGVDGAAAYIQFKRQVDADLNFYNNIFLDNLDAVDIKGASTGPLVVDFGGGALGSTGNNSITDYANYAVYNAVGGLGVSAQNNWWGTPTPDPAKFSGSVDYTHPLERAP